MSRADDPAVPLWIIGSGPSALALAQACCRRGIELGLVAPAPEAAWRPNYAMWRDEAEALGIAAHVAASWPRARASFAGSSRVLDRGYALVDDASLQRDWLAECRARATRVVTAEVVAVEHDDEGVSLRCADGRVLRGRLVVDASGHGSTFVERERERGAEPCYQVAWGELWTLAGPVEALCRPGEVAFMDWRAASPDEASDGLPPTFLYALPRADGRVFVEETILAAPLADPSSCLAPLRARLHARLDGLGLRRVGAAPEEVERCIIPMGTPLPLSSQRTLAFGGAASMVHPATGYLLANVLRRRERVATAIARELGTWVGPGAPSRRIWPEIWTTSEVQAWRLYTFGLGILSALERGDIDTFFSEFFTLGERHWRGFVSADMPSPKLMATMLRYYARAPRPIRARLSAALVGPAGRRMFRGFTGLSTDK